MTYDKSNSLTPDARRIELLLNAQASILNGSGGALSRIAALEQSVLGLINVQINAPPYPVGNLLYNGELGHSVNSWFDAAYVASNKTYECAFWYSHNKPAAAQTFVNADVNAGADTITLPAHEFTTGCTVDFLTTGNLPSLLFLNTTYFVIYIDANTIQVASTIGNAQTGTAIDLTADATGTQTIQQKLISTDARTSATNNELKNTSHSTYNPRYSRWDSINGQADLTGTTSIDALMPTNVVDSTTSLARISFIAAKLNSYIEIPSAALMAAGIWDNTSGQRCFLTGDIGFTAGVVGSTGTTQRRFRALLSSDRGYQLLSPEITLYNTLADGLLDSLNYIGMSWERQSGQLQVEIYEHYDPGGPGDSYRLVTTVSSATSFIYEGGYLVTVPGYPTPTGTSRTATFTTQTGDMSPLAINGTPWNTVNFPCNVPNDYNKGNTTNRQWVRIWMTVAANLFITDVTTDGTTTITIPDGAVDSASYGTGGTSLYAGLAVDVYDENDLGIISTTITSVTSDTQIVLADAIATGTNRQIRIIAGGFHGILLDKIHLGFQENTSYVPNANDNRVLQPVAAPASSTQGGVGGGGTGGGIHGGGGDLNA